jgi:hypothetical protein
MKKSILSIILVALVLGIASLSSAGTCTILDMPGASWTEAFGINGNNILGTYGDTSGKRHGFIYNGSSWITLDAPGATDTVAYSIDGSNIVGTYDGHGFLYDGSIWTTIDPPDSCDTYIRGISGNKIVGYYRDSTWDWHGFLYDGSSWTILDGVQAYGVDGNNIVGVSNTSGFLYDGSTWVTFSMPGSQITTAQDIYGDYIVGGYTNFSNGYMYEHGFLLNGSNWTILDVPGALDTRATGIDGNHIVGFYYYGNPELPNASGFLYTIPEPSSLLSMIGGLAFLFPRNKRRTKNNRNNIV